MSLAPVYKQQQTATQPSAAGFQSGTVPDIQALAKTLRQHQNYMMMRRLPYTLLLFVCLMYSRFYVSNKLREMI